MKPFRTAKPSSDGEQATETPVLWPPRPLATPSSYTTGMHSPLIPWPKPGGADDNTPFRRTK
jgi:hypothetical protein